MSMKRMGTMARPWIVAMAALALGACGTATVVKKNGAGGGGGSVPRTSVARPGATVTINKGDTLYAIARRTNVSPLDLAAWNNLSSPDTIYPGQTLKLYPGGGAVASRPVPASGGGSAAAPAVSRPAPVAPTPTPAASGFSWRWPADGVVVGNFVAGETTKQGIDIGGSNGQAVKAAADGVVVYSGSGLVGYGELIIIKHNEQWLSAYGHNRKRLVNEGQVVKASQQIAEMGRSGATRDMLHFEIRYNGKPVDPLIYLPKK
ncbi:peptidoglycan DD-metalloendopeptidase family protein [Stenotrophomonas sp. HITSZ_GD]|uniref:peptidoglycan DD-metalloendopeptidase family protein n=1 Tax=Stenotrophomonas sp. HITSZ_GD TaxID=3037248 RepID=UPI00240DE2E9|nr:peptidoglycan DD-metalloendopeptidase family protein [Stenotrophomonas sp. HITSZ_GD]MDG2527097.1 peptidoglycan DD-metalloendopeptidase family protein [Stenotrophomonas sp. HITSZ_GD]